MKHKIRLELVGITYNQIEAGVYALILQQVGTRRRIPIIIGFPEAQAIQCKLQEVVTPRPLTHDTMASALAAFGISLREVMIRRLPDGVFAADMIFENGEREISIDSRSSDAIALAIRVQAPIYTSPQVLREAGFDSEEERNAPPVIEESSPIPAADTPLQLLSLSQLSEAMMKAAENEDYEEAARIKSEIDARNNKPEQQ